jgi:preprotein translocase subunit SecA
MFSNVLKFLGGDPNKKQIEKLGPIIAEINGLEESYEKLTTEQLAAKTAEFRQRLAAGETLDDLLPEAFATVREASKRTIGLRHYDVQLIGGITLHQGKIAEMRTGEGKTLVATLPVYLNAITGKGVHLITVNDYLARRDARWMAPIYSLLGLSIGVLQMASRTENGRAGFLVDLEHSASVEDQHQLRMVPRRACYAADITYGTNSEFGFDYLRDNLTMKKSERVQRDHYYAIIDEVDNILIDEARTPLIISGPAQDEAEWYVKMAQVVRQLVPEDYEINEKDRSVTLTEAGEAHVEQVLDMALRDPERPEDITPEQARTLGYLEQALRAQHLYRRNKDYLVQGSKVVIVDEFTGRLMPGRRWSEGLHQAVEAKEGVKVEPENVTYATITIQNYFRMYDKLSGMTGTAETEAEEFSKIYELDVLPIPMNLEYLAAQKSSDMKSVESKDELGYRYTYYTRIDDTAERPLFWKRKDYPDVVFRSAEAKLRAITQEILHFHVIGRPQLVGTTSVEHSEYLSDRLNAEYLRRLAQVLLIRQAWMKNNNIDMITKPVEELQPLNRPINDLNTGELRQVARQVGISLSVEDPENLDTLAQVLNFKEEHKPRLVKALQGGIPHQVLNARRHDEESMIIAKAGAFGAVTIATNMAGRGVDIKLGGELAEETLADVNRVLAEKFDNPYDMTNLERRQALKDMPREAYGIYEEAVDAFLQYMEDMEQVRVLGGLHVIGSERHEARRIDNQLRGRAARQGDPGSSRFYLSLEDDLMRLFGGAQVESLWKRIFFDESQPLEMGLLGRIVEQSQERVEGANFDVRKHLLEYDDVLNAQRQRIYSQRDRVFEKENLSEDILDMLQTELQKRIPEGLKDEEGPWKLLAYLEQIQPPFSYETVSYPSYTFRMLIDEVRTSLPQTGVTTENLKQSMLTLAANAFEAEREHMQLAARNLLDRSGETLDQQIQERLDLVDTFFDGLEGFDEELEQAPRPQDLLAGLSELARVPFKLSNEELRRLPDQGRDVLEGLHQQVTAYMTAININRMVGAIERRLEESLNLRPADLQGADWDEAAGKILDSVVALFDQRAERLLGENGLVARDLEQAVSRLESADLNDQQTMDLLMFMSQGQRVAFDARTHRRSTRNYTRLNYIYLAARRLQAADPQQVIEDVLSHLEEALAKLEQARGLIEWNRLVQNEYTLLKIDEKRRTRLVEALGLERFEELAEQPLSEFEDAERQLVIDILGEQNQNLVYRELLLRVISEQWVDYLTRVEALRVSIGLEAYAQRDPLVQYKSQATEMFRQLLGDVRSGVISHVFTYRTQQRAPERARPDGGQAQTAAQPTNQPVAEDGKSRKKKRKRH